MRQNSGLVEIYQMTVNRCFLCEIMTLASKFQVILSINIWSHGKFDYIIVYV